MLLGAHESVAGGVHRAFARAEEKGCEALQLFTKSARGWGAPPLLDDEVARFRAEARRTGLRAVAHGSYLANLAAEPGPQRDKSLACVVEELTRCERLGIPDYVLHPGGHPDAGRGLGLVAEAVDAVHAACPGFGARLCLEVTAGQGSTLGWRFEHLTEILSRVAAPERLGVCLDTCHLFAAGYDLSTPRGYEQVMQDFDAAVGLSRVRCVHLNDSKKGLGARVDRHEHLGEGALGLAPFRLLVNDARLAHCVGVLETPDPNRYSDALRLLRSLRRK